jgi:chemotaxis protein MotD
LTSVVQAQASGVVETMTAPTLPVPEEQAVVLPAANLASGDEVLPDAAAARTVVPAPVETLPASTVPATPTDAEMAIDLEAVVKVSAETKPVVTAAPAPVEGDDVQVAPPAAPATAAVPAKAAADPAVVSAATNDETASAVANTVQVTAAAATAAALTMDDGAAEGEAAADLPVSPVVRQNAVAATAAKPSTEPQTPQEAADAAIADGEEKAAGREAGARDVEVRGDRPRADVEAAARRQPAAEARVGNPTSQHIVLPESLAAAPLATGVSQAQQALPQMPTNAMPAVTLAVASEMAAQHRAGASRFEIRLDPPELGRIDVRLDVDKAGNVRSHLIVERSETLDMLRSDQRNLEKALEQAGFKSDPNGISMSLRDDRGNQQQNARTFRQEFTSAPVAPVQDDIAPLATPTTRSAASGSSNLDIRV